MRVDDDIDAFWRDAGIAQAQTFSWRATAEKTLAAYRRAM